MNWQTPNIRTGTILDLINQSFLKLQGRNAYSFPNLRHFPTLIMTSDYSGESHDAPYLVYSFLITSLDGWMALESKRLSIRERFLVDGRRISFKRMGDANRKQALEPFLSVADELEGLSLSIGISKRCETLFAGSPPLDLTNPDFASFTRWKSPVLEKAFTIVHFLGFLLAGLSRSAQNVFWFTDEDSIAANEQRVYDLTHLFVWITAEYLPFTLGHFRCGTSRCDDGSRQIEDLLAIPDLIAGALAEQLKLKMTTPPDMPDIFWMHRPDYTDKSKTITWWYSRVDSPLKRIFCTIDPSSNGKKHVLSFYHFYDRP